MTYLLVRYQYGLVQQDTSTLRLVIPTTAQIYLSDNTTLATVYSNSGGTPLTNSPSVPHGVTPGQAGIDTSANLVWWGDPTKDYSVLFNGIFEPVPTSSIHHTDATGHIENLSDPHQSLLQAKAYADANFINNTTDLTALIQAATAAYINANLGID